MIKRKEHQIRVGVPAMPLDGGASGIGVYCVKLLQHLSRREDLELVVFGFECEQHLLNLGTSARFVPVPEKWMGVLPNILWHSTMLPVLCARHRVDVLWLPAGNRRMTPGVPHVYTTLATVHDLAQFNLSNKYDVFRMYYVTRVLPLLWKATPGLVAVSQSTADDLVTHTSIEAERMAVIYNGVDSGTFLPQSPETARGRLLSTYDLPSKYMIYVARIEHPGKNHVNLLRALRLLYDQNPELPHDLVLCGKNWNGAEMVHSEIERLGLEERVHCLGFVDEAHLPDLYSASDLMVFPSLYEGFGIPIIEAMAAGIPVVSSNRASLPEVVGDVGLLFDPLDPEAIVEKIRTALLDAGFRQRAAEQGPIRAKRFSWERCADEMSGELRRMLTR